MRRTQRVVSRRDIVRAIPVLTMLSAFAGVGVLSSACEVEHPDYLTARRKRARGAGVTPTDDDEYVPDETTLSPTNAGDAPPEVPNASWEARARQIEGEQARLHGAVFTADVATNRAMAGKERSHVPRLELASETRRVTVRVDHVMGGGGVAVDGGGDARPAEAGTTDAALSDAAIVDATAADAGGVLEHYITTIYLRAIVDGQDVVVGLWELASTDPAPAAVTFTLPAGVTSVAAYEWCTLHGLWKSDSLAT